jgi:nucleoid-associated protein YgaU
MNRITVAGGNLFALAAEHLGDATQWIRIARANDLSDPFLTGVVVLDMPAPDPNYSGDGIASADQ